MSAVGARLLSAVMIGASFGPWHQAWLGWISFVPALVAVTGTIARRRRMPE